MVAECPWQRATMHHLPPPPRAVSFNSTLSAIVYSRLFILFLLSALCPFSFLLLDWAISSSFPLFICVPYPSLIHRPSFTFPSPYFRPCQSIQNGRPHCRHSWWCRNHAWPRRICGLNITDPFGSRKPKQRFTSITSYRNKRYTSRGSDWGSHFFRGIDYIDAEVMPLSHPSVGFHLCLLLLIRSTSSCCFFFSFFLKSMFEVTKDVLFLMVFALKICLIDVSLKRLRRRHRWLPVNLSLSKSEKRDWEGHPSFLFDQEMFICLDFFSFVKISPSKH